MQSPDSIQTQNIMFKKAVFLFVFTLIAFSFYSCKNDQTETPYVVMLSMDGFRWDYPDKAPTPNLDRIARQGIKAESLKPSFPTKTFPNHYSMATGLYPDHHGIVANTFIDRKSNRTFKIVDPETRGDHYFYGGEPIWITAEKQGLRTASYFWVGSDVDGLHPTYWKPYENSIPYEQRIDSIIAWLQMPQPQRPHLITWYFPEPDMTGHTYGPDSPQIDSLITALDRYVGIFMDKLEKLPVYPHTNVIITSDHGMASISPEQVIRIHELLPDSLIVAYSGSNPVITIDVVDEYIDLAKSILQEQPHLKVWKSSEVPERLHYGTHERTLDLIVAADNHWSIFYNDAELTSKGTHGFDNDEKDMHAIFYAMGPAFKTNTTVPTFENVSLYTLIATIMNLKPEPTDGSPEHIKPMLK